MIVGVFRRDLREVRSESLRNYGRLERGGMIGMDARQLMARETEKPKHLREQMTRLHRASANLSPAIARQGAYLLSLSIGVSRGSAVTLPS